MSRDRRKVSTNQHKRHIDQVKLPGVSQSYVLDCFTNSKKFSVEFFVFFFSINEELRRVLLTNIAMENAFFQILDTECVAGKRVNVPI